MKHPFTKLGLALLVTLVMAACTDSSKPTSDVTLDQIKQDAVNLAFIQAKFEKLDSLEVISQPVQDNQCLVVADLTYDNGDALISGQVVINYEWANKAWKAVNTQFSFTAVSVKEEAPEADVLKAAGPIDELSAQFETDAVPSTSVLESRSLDLAIGEATYVVKKTQSLGLWSATTLITIKAKYYYLEGWKYTVDSWTYTETTQWAGTWTILWTEYEKETQYKVDEKMTITVKGDMTLTKNSAGDQTEDRSVNVTFRRNNSNFNLPATLSRDYLEEGRYSSRFFVIKYGNQDNDQFNFELRFDETNNPTTAITVAKSFDGNLGVLTKIR